MMTFGGRAMTNAEPWLSVEEIANHLGVSKETIYRWLDKGRIPSHRMGKLWKFKSAEVDAWVRSGGAKAQEAAPPGPGQNNLI
jgi:excisionase family DNA binding protein